MSTSITVIRKCLHCKSEFEAKTTKTKYCSHACSSRAAKARAREKKIEASNLETKQIIVEEKITQLDSEYLTVAEVANALQVSNRTIYSFIKKGKIKAVNLSIRLTRIERTGIVELIKCLELNRSKEISDSEAIINNKASLSIGPLTIGNCYAVPDLCTMFETNRGNIYSMMKRKNVPKLKHKKETFFAKLEVDKLFRLKDKPRELGLEKIRKANSKIKTVLKLEDCYTIEEIEELFNGKRSNLYAFLRRRNVPVLRVGNDVYHSKKVVNGILKAIQK